MLQFVKICPDCSYANSVYTLRCAQCNRSLAGVRPDFPPSLDDFPPEEPLQEDETQRTLSLDELSPEVPIQTKKPQQTVLPHQLSPALLSQPIPTTPQPRLTEVFSPSVRAKSKRNWIVKLIMVIIALLAITSLLFALLPRFWDGNSCTSTALCEFKASNGELLGINDGSLVPFLLGKDKQEIAFKQQAAVQTKQGHSSQAISLWEDALKRTNNDPEAWIYLENELVLLSASPYRTLVVGTNMFDASGADQSGLQGVYVAQHEFNTANHGFRIRILIANSGTDINNVTAVAQQIAHLAQQDKTIVGVISWQTSAESFTALQTLSAAHIPLIAPTASSDTLSNASPFFFRIVPPNRFQGRATALFAEQSLHVQKVVVFVDNHDPYSQNLAQDFEKQFRQDKGVVLKEESFTTDQTSKIGNLIQDALATHPDALYFTGREPSDVTNFQDALPTTGPFAHTLALAGDAGYVIHKAGYGRWYFASFAFPNELENLTGNSSPPAPFYQDYSDDFNQDGLKPAGYYGYTRPDDNAMLSYDVTSVFLAAMQMAIGSNKIAVTPAGLQSLTPDMLAHTLPDVVLQGVSGLIKFDTAHDPVDKAFVFLAASPDGYTYMKDWQGCFTQDLCHNIS
jgi:ABC-type branched-subunit amino acid transport system substrate-binding protein